MTEKQKATINLWINLLGPVITVLILGGTMALSYGAQGQKIDDLTLKVDKLYELLIYPRFPSP